MHPSKWKKLPECPAEIFFPQSDILDSYDVLLGMSESEKLVENAKP